MAGGTYGIYIPPCGPASIAFTQIPPAPAIVVAGYPGAGQPFRPLAYTRPQILTHWSITQLYVPVAASVAGTGLSATDTVVITITLNINGRSVYSASSDPTTPNEFDSVDEVFWAFIQADLVNPIGLDQGDDLELLMSASLTTSGTVSLFATVAGITSTAAPGGQITYVVTDRPGVHQIS